MRTAVVPPVPSDAGAAPAQDVASPYSPPVGAPWATPPAKTGSPAPQQICVPATDGKPQRSTAPDPLAFNGTPCGTGTSKLPSERHEQVAQPLQRGGTGGGSQDKGGGMKKGAAEAADVPRLRPDDWAGPWIVGDSPRPRDMQVMPRPGCVQACAGQWPCVKGLDVAVPSVAQSPEWAVTSDALAHLGAELSFKVRVQFW
jgi:hypothetical protein